MSPDVLITQWDIPWAVTAALVVTALIYVRGWSRIRRTRSAQFPAWRLVALLGGVFALFVAVASPLDTFSESLLFMHMAQHFVLMSVAPPLIVLGAPVVPMLRGLPRDPPGHPRPADAPRPAPAAAAPDARDAEIERLARRVDELEARLARLEAAGGT